MSQIAAENLSLLVELWLNRATGQLVVPADDGEERLVPMVDGGLVDGEDWDRLLRALDRGPLQLARWPMTGQGDRRQMGAALWVAARALSVDLRQAFDDVQQASGPWDGLLANLDLDGLLARAELQGEADHRAQDLLERGHLALLRLDWQDADQLFSRALERRMDTPVALAALAWARLNNPSWPVEARRASAWRLALLASQLAPQDAQVSALLAAFRQAADEDASPLDNACSSAA